MKWRLPAGRRISYYTLLAWLVPSVSAGMVSIFAFLGVSFLEYRNGLKRTEVQILDNSFTIARRISSELLIGDRGAPDLVGENLRQDFGLSHVTVSSDTPACWSAEADACTRRIDTRLFAYRKLPVIPDSRYVEIIAEIEPFSRYLRISYLLWSTLPIALMFGIGLFFQRMVLRKYLLQPIQSLVATSTGEQEPKAYWPKELREISERLYRSFEARDAAIFSQIARGVIHDLRTLIQSPLTATDLSVESLAKSAEKRKLRLENLESVCAEQLPKMRDIIDTTLDGSREIPILQTHAPLEMAVTGARTSLEPLIKKTGTSIAISIDPKAAKVAHDPLQLERAITNLLKNGIEASALGNTPSPSVSVRIRQDRESVAIDVEDSGPGLLFQPDRLFRPLKSTKPHGSGLGLVISRKIVAAHGGELRASNSEILGGAKFSIILPNNSQEAT